MKHYKTAIRQSALSIFTLFFFCLLQSCSDNTITQTNSQTGEISLGSKVVNLVSDTASYHPHTLDPNLVNAWGMAVGSTGLFWVSSADKGLSTIYDRNGNISGSPVTIPGA